MGAIQDVLQQFGQETVDIIQGNISRAGQNVSGQTSQSIQWQTPSDSHLIVDGARHVFVLETGRGPGKMPPIGVIPGWIEDKPVSITGTVQNVGFAFSKVIAEKGTKLFQQGGRTDIITPAVSDERIDQLTNDIADASFKMTLNVIDKALPGQKTLI